MRRLPRNRTMIANCGLLLTLLLGLSGGLVQADPVEVCEYGRTQLVFPNDPFEQRQYTGATNLGWIKFTILNPPYDPNIVYSLWNT